MIELINQLPQKQKEALLLSADGAPYKEIAETMNISLSNAKVLVKRGRDRLKHLLKVRYPDDCVDIVGDDVMRSLLDE